MWIYILGDAIAFILAYKMFRAIDIDNKSGATIMLSLSFMIFSWGGVLIIIVIAIADNTDWDKVLSKVYNFFDKILYTKRGNNKNN